MLLDYSFISTKPDKATPLQQGRKYDMSELQLSGLLFILIGALPSYLLTNYIEKGKHWTLFSGWDPIKIRDQDAYGSMLCKGVRMFSLAFAVLGILMMLGVVANDMLILMGTFVCLSPLFFSMHRAKRLFGK